MASQSAYLDKQIGNYRIVSELAAGSFGSVFLAHHLYLKQRTVVIKILHAIHLGSPEEKEQFLQEAQILEMLKGLPFILPLLDVGIDGDIPYLITEYAQQGSLRQRIKQHGSSPFSLQEMLPIIAQVGQGLQEAHDKNIVHRDLKPENILFNLKGEALLADFGISTVLSTGSVQYTQHVLGTPAYMAPEQFMGEVSKESDQYGLACITYELLTGQKPFTAPDFVSMGFLHTSQNPVPPSERNLNLPSAVDRVILKALAKDRHDRYSSVSAFVQALQEQATERRARGKTVPLSQLDTTVAVPPVTALPPTIAAIPPTIAAVPPQHSYRPEPQLPSSPQTPLRLPAHPYTDDDLHSTPFQPYPGNAVYPYHPQPAQAQVGIYAPPHYTGNAYSPAYTPPAQNMDAGQYDPFLAITLSMKVLAALCYLLPLLSWIVYFISGRRNRFARFHYMQSVLAWLLWFLCSIFLNPHPANGASATTSPLFNFISGILFLVAIRFAVEALRGNYPRFIILNYFAERFANKRPA